MTERNRSVTENVYTKCLHKISTVGRSDIVHNIEYIRNLASQPALAAELKVRVIMSHRGMAVWPSG